jgi:hypothetical protein
MPFVIFTKGTVSRDFLQFFLLATSYRNTVDMRYSATYVGTEEFAVFCHLGTEVFAEDLDVRFELGSAALQSCSLPLSHFGLLTRWRGFQIYCRELMDLLIFK